MGNQRKQKRKQLKKLLVKPPKENPPPKELEKPAKKGHPVKTTVCGVIVAALGWQGWEYFKPKHEAASGESHAPSSTQVAAAKGSVGQLSGGNSGGVAIQGDGNKVGNITVNNGVSPADVIKMVQQPAVTLADSLTKQFPFAWVLFAKVDNNLIYKEECRNGKIDVKWQHDVALRVFPKRQVIELAIAKLSFTAGPTTMSYESIYTLSSYDESVPKLVSPGIVNGVGVYFKVVDAQAGIFALGLK